MKKFAQFVVLDAWTATPARFHHARRSNDRVHGNVIERAHDGAFRHVAHKHEFDYEPRQGYLYVRSRAISSRINDNFDHFPAEEIANSYLSFVGKPTFVNHNNDNHRRARGVIIAAALHEDVTPQGTPDTWCEVLMEIDAVNFPKLAKAILEGRIDRTSMGVDVAESQCSVCGNLATTPLEYCAHIPGKKGSKLRRTSADGTTQDHLIYETCRGLHFFENSLLVEDPADPTAYFLGVDDRGVGGGYRGNVPHTAASNDRRTCESCGTTTEDWVVAMTPWQIDDPDSFEEDDDVLLANGARVLCIRCSNNELNQRQGMVRTASRHQANESFDIDMVPANKLKAGDQIIQPETSETLTISKAVRSRRKDDKYNQWITLEFSDGRSVEVHEGDYIDRIRRDAMKHKAAADYTSLTNTELMDSIARIKKQIDDSLQARGPRTGPAFVKAHYEDELGDLMAEKARRMKMRREDPDGWNATYGSRHTAYGETVAPAAVDTMREQACPVCGDEDSYDGEKCNTCGYLKPPDEFMDPDLDKASETDLRQDEEDAANGNFNDSVTDLEGDDKEDGGIKDEMFRLEKPDDEDLDPDAAVQEPTTTEGEVVGDEDDLDDADEEDDPDDEDGSDKPDVDVDVDVDTDDDDKSDDEDDDDDDSPFELQRKKKKKATTAGRNPARRPITMRETLAALAAHAKVINRQGAQQKRLAIQTNANKLMIERVAQLAGVKIDDIQHVANRKIADVDNPAQPVSEPSPETPTVTTEELRDGIGPDTVNGGESVLQPGATSETDVSPTATTDVTEPGGAPLPDADLTLDEEDVTRPVAGANEPIELSKKRTEGDVTAIDEVRTETAFPIEDASYTSKVSSTERVFACLRLARLRIHAGIEQGDDLAAGQTLAMSAKSDAEISNEIVTLEAAIKSMGSRPAAPAQPRQAARLTPSLAGTSSAGVEGPPASAVSQHVSEATSWFD